MLSASPPRPSPFLRCIAQALQGDEPGEKCNGLLNTGHSSQQNPEIRTASLHRRTALRATTASWSAPAGDASKVNYSQSTQLDT